MSKFAEGFENVVRECKPVELVDKHLEPVGVEITIGPKTTKRYQSAERKFQDRLSSGKKVSVKERRDLMDRLLLSRIEGWRFHGKAAEKFGQPEFNHAMVNDFFFEAGQQGLAFLEQAKAAISDYDENFPED